MSTAIVTPPDVPHDLIPGTDERATAAAGRISPRMASGAPVSAALRAPQRARTPWCGPIASVNGVRPQVQFDGCAGRAHRVINRWLATGGTRDVIESRAAVLHNPGERLKIETISVEP